MIRRPAISPLFPYTTLVRSELEPFGPVQCHQMGGAPVRTRRPEASPQVCDELSGRPNAVVELLRKADETSEIGLAHHLSFTELLGQPLAPAGLCCVTPHRR